jgi:hypothetical protein
MSNLSDESRMIVASNLTVAAILRDIYTHLTGEKPLRESDDFILNKFNSIVKSLSSGSASSG